MSTSLRHILRLPPAVRTNAITSLLYYQPRLQCIHRRPFTTTPQYLNGPPKPTRLRKPSPTQQKQPSPRPQPAFIPRNPQNHQPRPLQPSAYLKGDTTQVLLYRAPSHTSFYIVAYFCGACIVLGAVNFALYAKDTTPFPSSSEPDEGRSQFKSPWYIKTLTLFVSLAFGIFGTTFLLAPTKLIRTISLVSTATPHASAAGLLDRGGMDAMLKFEMKHPLPFLRNPFKTHNDTITVPAPTVFLSGYIDKLSPTKPLHYHSIPLSDSAAFTASHLSPLPKPRRGVLDMVRAFNAGLVDAGPRFMRDVSRMFLRDGMAYVRIPDRGNWKIDLQGAEVLDDTRPLEKVMRIDMGNSRGLPGWLQNLLGGR